MIAAALMFVSFRHAENRIIEHVRAGGHRVTLAQARVFARIGPDGTRLTELAEAAQVTKQTAGFLVDQLQAEGYVERVPDPRDARARLVRVAARGEEAVARAREMEQTVEREWEEHLGPARMAALRDALTGLREITDPYA